MRSRIDKMADYLDSVDQPATEEARNERKKQEEARKKWERFQQDLTALCLVLSSIAVVYYTDFFHKVMYSPKVSTTMFYLGITLSFVGVSICTYLIVDLGYIKKAKDWDKEKPTEIMVATFSFVSSYFVYTIAFWPIWGFWTPAILLNLSIGLFLVLIRVPL